MIECVQITIFDDTDPEDTESFFVALDDPQPDLSVLLGGVSSAVVTIIDNDIRMFHFKDYNGSVQYEAFLCSYTRMLYAYSCLKLL